VYNGETNKKNTGYKMHRQIAEGVDWIGYVDWPVRNFHGYTTRRGSSYNAYLVRGKEKTALIDTVKAPFSHELIANISEIVLIKSRPSSEISSKRPMNGET
jgi:flavorubredoxin